MKRGSCGSGLRRSGAIVKFRPSPFSKTDTPIALSEELP